MEKKEPHSRETKQLKTYAAFEKSCRRAGLYDEFLKVCVFVGISLIEAYAPKRTKARVAARKACWRIMRDRGLSLTDIGDFWGGYDHGTVLFALKQTQDPKLTTQGPKLTLQERHTKLVRAVRAFIAAENEDRNSEFVAMVEALEDEPD
jgi:Bacterial dnaA protein helix-turn-helix